MFRRVGRRGFVMVERTNADRVHSKVLGAWLRCVGEGPAQRVRLADDAHGDVLVPTELEAERARLEAERARRVAAEAEVVRLRAELAALRK